MEFPKGNTMGDIMDAIFKIHEPAEAKQFFDDYVEFVRQDQPGQDAVDIVSSNIGWMFGEGRLSDRQVAMWTALGASHPVFGSTKPTPEEAFKAGMKMGETMRKKREADGD